VVQTAMYWGNAKTNGGAYPSTWLVIGLPCGLSFLADLNVFRYRRPAQEHPIVATAISATLVTFAWLLARFVAAPLLS